VKRDYTPEHAVSLIDDVQRHLGPAEIQQISQHLGVDEGTAQSAVQSALPMMVAGMAGNAQQPGGESQIQSLLGGHGGLLGSLSSVIASASAGAGMSDGAGGAGGLLGSIFGAHRDSVQNSVQQTSNLQPDQTKKLLAILAPIVLAVLARRHAAATADGKQASGSLGGALQQDAQAAQGSVHPQLGGILGKIMSHVEGPRA
jgi:hypothetical protein